MADSNLDDKDRALAIDLNQLEECAVEQPKLMREWGDKAAVARRTAKELKAAFKLRQADLMKDICARPSNYGLEKTTEKMIEAALISNDDYQTYQTQLIQAEFELDLVESMLDAVNDRRSEIEVATRLFGQTYWAKPYVASETRQKMREEGEQGVATKRSKK